MYNGSASTCSHGANAEEQSAPLQLDADGFHAVTGRRRERMRPDHWSDDAEPIVASRAVPCAPPHEAETHRGVGYHAVSNHVHVRGLMDP
jgi:hypothetical protein